MDAGLTAAEAFAPEGQRVAYGSLSRRACDPFGAKTKARLIVFEALVPVEEPNKENGRPQGQDVKKTADDATAGNNQAKNQ